MARYYDSQHWKELRADALERDGGMCTTPGCGAAATHVDHHHPRPKGAEGPTSADVLGNMRSRCKPCHSSKTASTDGGFANPKGKPRDPAVRGCDADGWPMDPAHPWNAAR